MTPATALAGTHSGRFQSCGTEIGLARPGYAAANHPLNPSLIEADVLRPVVLGLEGVGALVAPRDNAGVAVRMAGDLSPRGARSRRQGLESSRQPHGESRRTRGTN